MSVDKLMREMVREEVARAVAPLQQAIASLKAQGQLTARLASALGVPASGKRGPGRPRIHAIVKVKRGPGRPPGSGKRGRPSAGERPCAVIGCTNPARSKGYCANHYQKLRNLQKTNRTPPDWQENAPAQSVKNIELPRGRAARLK